MKYLLIAVLFFSYPSFSQTPVLQYKLELKEDRIKVDLLFTPVTSDSAQFTYGNLDYGGQKDIWKGLQELTVEPSVRFLLDTAARILRFYYLDKYPIHINYDVVDTRYEFTTRSQLFRPLILPDYFFVHGFNLFLTPVFGIPLTKIPVSVAWSTPPLYPVFLTYDPNNKGDHTTVTTADSINFRFLTGAADLKVKKFPSKSGQNFLVLRTKGMQEDVEKRITNFYLVYNDVMREFWSDKRIINYSLVLQPYIKVDHDLSGVSFGNGFIGKYNRSDSLDKGVRLFVLAHEIGHYYLGDVAAFEGEENIGQWFNEGFNDYLTYCNLLRSGMLTPRQFEENFNKLFQSFYSSKIRFTPNDKIFENFWLLGDYQHLPYWRGCLYAFYLDNQITIASKGKASIRSLMLELKRKVTAGSKKEFSNEEFIEAVSRFLSPEIARQQMNEFICKGTPIHFSETKLMSFFQITMKEDIPFLTISDIKKFIKHYQFK